MTSKSRPPFTFQLEFPQNETGTNIVQSVGNYALRSQNHENIDLLIRPYLSHKFFGGKHELVVNHPSWMLLEQAAVRVNVDCL